MKANNCGQGLAVFSLTLVFGIFLNNLVEGSFFFEKVGITESISVISKDIPATIEKEERCFKEFEKFNLRADEETKSEAPLINQLAEVKNRLLKNKNASSQEKKKLLELKKKLEEKLSSPRNFEKLPLTPTLKSEPKKLLYTENCYKF